MLDRRSARSDERKANQPMNTFSIVLATGPLAVYCVVLGLIHLRRRPKVVSGGRDLACLGLAMIGLFLIGPAELFFPQAAFNLFGASVWVALVALYLFLLLFLILNTRPSLIVFGLDVDSLTAHVDQILQQLDPGTKWLNHSFVAPALGIHGTIEPAGIGKVSHVVATQLEQNAIGWLTLGRALSLRLKDVPIDRRLDGVRWMTVGVVILSLIGYTLILKSTAITKGISEMLRN
jgi:hypothetical protein